MNPYCLDWDFYLGTQYPNLGVLTLLGVTYNGAQGDDHEGEEDVAHDVHSCQGCWGAQRGSRRGRRPPPAAVLMPPESMHAQYPSEYPSWVLSTQIPVEALVVC